MFAGNGDGTFQAPVWFGLGPDPAEVVSADLHGQGAASGLPDVVVTDGSGKLLVLLNTTP